MNPITLKDINDFIKYPHLFGDFLGYKDLIPLHTDWIYDAWIRDTPSLQAHRNSYKTTSILIVGALWRLLFWNKNNTILIIRKSETDAQKIVKTIKSHCESPKVIAIAKFLHGVDTLKTDNWSNSSITLSIKDDKTPEGNIEAKGTTSNIVGAHYDYILPDDIITLKDRVSKAEREWIKDFVRELRNIKKEDGKLFFSGTIWHRDDAWTIIPKPKRYPIGTAPIKGFTEDVLEKKIAELRAGTTTSLYSANYELVHISDEDCLFGDPKYGDWPEDVQPIGYLDPSYEGDNTTALTIMGICNGWPYARGYVWKDSIINHYNDVIIRMKENNAGTLFIETNADKGLSKKEIEKLWPLVEGVNERENKEYRIEVYAVKYYPEIIWHPETQVEYMAQLLDYIPRQDPDDVPDSLAGACRQLGFVDDNEVYVGIA